MHIMRAACRDPVTLLLLLWSCLALLAVAKGEVTVELEIEAGDGSEAIASAVQQRFEEGTLDLYYPILSLKVFEGTTNDGDGDGDVTGENSSSSRIITSSLFFLLFSLFFFVSPLSFRSRSSNVALLCAALILFLACFSAHHEPVLSHPHQHGYHYHPQRQTSYENCKRLAFDDAAASTQVDYKLFWTVDAEEDLLHLSLEANTRGWLGLGVSLDGTMNSGSDPDVASDMLVGWLNDEEDGGDQCLDGCVYDCHTFVRAQPKMDEHEQNVQLQAAARDGERLTLEVSRKLTATEENESEDLSIDPNEETWVIFATNTQLNPTIITEELSFDYHGSTRGSIKLRFGEPSSCEGEGEDKKWRLEIVLDTLKAHFLEEVMMNALMESLELGEKERGVFVVKSVEGSNEVPCQKDGSCESFVIAMPEYQVGEEETQYMCTVVTLPSDDTYDGVRFKPYVDQSLVVHHMILYRTQSELTGYPEVFECSSMPPGTDFMWGWAAGGEDFIPPDDVGVRFGAGTDSLYGVLQVHYNNPGGRTDIVDSSGVEIFYTTELREQECGFLYLGPVTDLAIPPGMPEYVQRDTCEVPSDQANVATVIAYLSHMHQIGRKVITEHFSADGRPKGTFGNANFDYNDQEFVPLIPPVVVDGGDRLRTTCTWDSTSRAAVTNGCEATACEMCINVVAYYPRMEVQTCGGDKEILTPPPSK
ncbi:DBH-like monooxygenase protein 1 [Balamuthia mandrillaris]